MSGAAAREGKGIGTASFWRGHEDEEEEKEHVVVVEGKEVEGVEGCEDDDNGVGDGGGGLEKMMCESDGVGNKSMPNSLAMVASLYVSVMISFVGRNSRPGVLDLLLLILLLLNFLLILLV